AARQCPRLSLVRDGTFRHAGRRPKGDNFRRGPAPQGRALNLPLRAGPAIEDRLLVEDDAVVADAVARSLVAARQLDARVTRADSMGLALRQIARAKFALVMTDLDLPDSSGLATLVTLRH